MGDELVALNTQMRADRKEMFNIKGEIKLMRFASLSNLRRRLRRLLANDGKEIAIYNIKTEIKLTGDKIKRLQKRTRDLRLNIQRCRVRRRYILRGLP